MCLAIPGKVVCREQNVAKVDFGDGVVREVNVSLVDAAEGEYVIVHAGFAIQKMDQEEAGKVLDVWSELLDRVGE